LRVDYPLKGRSELCFALECTLGAVFSLGRAFVGPNASPMEAYLPYRAPAHAPSYESILCCPVYFDAAHAELRFERAFLDTPRLCSDSTLLAVLTERAEALLTLRTTNQLLHRKVSVLLKEDHGLLADETGTMLGKKLGISPRALRRRLRSEGVTLRTVRDEIRKQQAFQLLAQTAMPVKAISERLGFSECSPFYRAFRRWSDGATPADFRHEHKRKKQPAEQ
jgi:hypothetical protein